MSKEIYRLKEALPSRFILDFTLLDQGHYQVVYEASFMAGKRLILTGTKDIESARRRARHFLPAAIFDNLRRLFADFIPGNYVGGEKAIPRWSLLIQELGTSIQQFCTVQEARRRWLKTGWAKR